MTSEECAVQLYDDPSSDRASARYISFNAPYLRAAQFVIITCRASERTFLGQVSGPNLNFNRNALSPTDNTAINQLEQITLGTMNRDVAVKEIFFYEIVLLKEIITGRPESVRVRPQIGAFARAATEQEIIDLLGLPKTVESQIGSIIDTQVPICISKQILMSHVLVAGATGSGKTNSIANIVNAANIMNMSVVKFDHKPDYQHVHIINNDGSEPYFRALKDVEYWYIGQPLNVPGRAEAPILVAARELDPLMLTTTIFYHDHEQIQAETCHNLLQHYIEGRPNWTMQGFKEWIGETEAAKLPGKPKKEVYDAIRRKINLDGRVPSWIDAKPRTMGSQFFKTDTRQFRPNDLIHPGRVAVIRIGSEVSDGRQYGLLLSYVLNKINQRAEQHQLPCPVDIVIDEAQDIFSASEQFKQAALADLNRHVRKGRSKRIGYTIGVQSADAIPKSILNNLNSLVIHRHNSHEQVRIAANMATEDQRRMTNSFGAGEALVFLIGSNGIVHARMRRSPFKLTKEELETIIEPNVLSMAAGKP